MAEPEIIKQIFCKNCGDEILICNCGSDACNGYKHIEKGHFCYFELIDNNDVAELFIPIIILLPLHMLYHIRVLHYVYGNIYIYHNQLLYQFYFHHILLLLFRNFCRIKD